MNVDEENPWLGLRSFSEDVSQYFFGRDREIPELSDRIRQRPLTILYGQSGLGKTSLLNAGVIPRLRQQGYAPVLIRVIYDPQLQPLAPEQQLLQEFARHFPNAPQPATAAPTLWDLFHDPQFGFADEAGTSAAAKALPRPVLLLDQFEEIFTLGLTLREQQTRELFEALACIVENKPPESARRRLEDDDYADRVLQHVRPCRVVFSMRDDYLHQLERWRRQMPSMMDNRCELRRLSGKQAFDAAFNPGLRRRAAGKGPPILAVETAEQIVRLAAGKSADVPLEEIENVPPLLSLICEQLNLRRLRAGHQTIDSANMQGTADEVLRDFCRDNFRGAHPAVREFVEQRLVSGAGIRQSVNLESAELELRVAGVPTPEQALKTLIDRRLLTIEDRGGISRLELTHDILAPVIVRSRTAGTSEQSLQTALAVYDSLADPAVAGPSPDQRIAERLFRSLSQHGMTGETVRRQPSQTLETLAAEIGADVSRTVAVARQFAERGILVLQPAHAPAGPSSVADVEHRSLFSEWKLLSTWIAQEHQDADDFRTLRNLQHNGVRVLDDTSLKRAELFFDRVRPTVAWVKRYDSAVASQTDATQSLLSCQQLVQNSITRRKQQRLITRLAIALAVVFFAGAGWWVWDQSRRQESRLFTQKFLAAPAAFVGDLEQHRREALPILLQKYEQDDPAHPEQKLHAAWGLARLQPEQRLLDYLTAQVPRLSSQQFRGTAVALKDLLDALRQPVPEFVSRQLQAVTDNRKIELRWLLMGLALGETQRLDYYCQAKPDPSDTTQLMLDLPTVPIDVDWLNQVLAPSYPLAAETRYLLCLVAGGLQAGPVEAESSLRTLFTEAPDPGTHAAARWALQQLQYTDDVLENMIAGCTEQLAEQTKRDWYVTPRLGPPDRQVPGFTMVRIPSHPDFPLGSVTDEIDNDANDPKATWQPRDAEPVKSFWMSDREVSQQQIIAVLEDDARWQQLEPRWQTLRSEVRLRFTSSEAPLEANALPADVPWYDAVDICNLLSVYAGLEPAYEIAKVLVVEGSSFDAREETLVSLARGKGYRLPAEREWEYACRALSLSRFSFGDDEDNASLYAVVDGSALVRGGRRRPSRWGLFDMHGSMWEWCWDRHDTSRSSTADDGWDDWWIQSLEDSGSFRVLRGGSWRNVPNGVRCALRYYFTPEVRANNDGFRLVLE